MTKAMLGITHRFVGYRHVANIEDGQLRFKLCPRVRSQFWSLSGDVSVLTCASLQALLHMA